MLNNPKSGKDNNTDQDANISSDKIYNAMLENLDVKEIFNLCKQVTEKYPDTDKELYNWFHDESNIGGEKNIDKDKL